MHRVWAQVSSVVHALPSSQGKALGGFTQPVAGTQLSVVHTLPSSQSAAEVSIPAHEPSAQLSPVVHALPSSQFAVLGEDTQPNAPSQASSVQRFPSSQSGAAPPGATSIDAGIPCGTCVSIVTRGRIGSDGAPLVRVTAIGRTGVAIVAVGTAPPVHTPSVQISADVQAFPSLQGMGGRGVFMHPVSGSQLSAVQGLASSHTTDSPALHTPFLQASPVVHRSPSSQGASAYSKMQSPLLKSQYSSVQGLPSLQGF